MALKRGFLAVLLLYFTGDNKSKNVIFGVALDKTVSARTSFPDESLTPRASPFSTKISETS
jgi:hypothetical protein